VDKKRTSQFSIAMVMFTDQLVTRQKNGFGAFETQIKTLISLKEEMRKYLEKQSMVINE
jgi:hypothetical protein